MLFRKMVVICKNLDFNYVYIDSGCKAGFGFAVMDSSLKTTGQIGPIIKLTLPSPFSA